MESVQGWRACRAKSVICGHGEQHRNNILYNLKYGRGAKCERSHYMKTAGRKCFATAENLQVQSDHQTVTLHLAWRLRSVDRYLPCRKGWIRCHTFVYCSLSLFSTSGSFFFSPLTNLTFIFFKSPPHTFYYFFLLFLSTSSSCFVSCLSCLSFLFSSLTSSCICLLFLPSPTFPFKLSHSCLCHPLSLSVCGQSHLI